MTKPRSPAEITAHLKEFPFFRRFLGSYLEQLVKHTEVISAPVDSIILSEGQVNNNLYFLSSGSVGVFVDGEKVATLDKPGDLLGEMSVITAQPVSATIRAETDVEFYCIHAENLAGLSSGMEENFPHLLFRTYAMILSEKLVVTNQKARRFEVANRDLIAAQKALEEINVELERKVKERTADLVHKTKELEQQNTELLASHRKLEDLYGNREATFKKLSSLYHDHFKPLRNSLKDLEAKAVDQSFKNLIHIAKGEVEAALGMLKPMTTLYSSEQAIKSKRVLLAEGNTKQQIIAKLALGGTGVSLDIAGSVEDALALLGTHHYDLIFTSPELAAVARAAHERALEAKLVFMASTDIPAYLPTLRENAFFSNIVSRDEEDRTFTVKNIMTTVSKLVAHDLFGLEKYLTWGVDVKSLAVNRSDERGELIEEMQEHFQHLGVRRSIAERCALVAEELLMNAIYDAPVDENGNVLYNHFDRKQAIALKPHECGEFRFACDGMLAAISVSDPFGGFRTDILLNYLDSCYGGRAGTLNTDKGGAGRGLHQIIENSDLVVFNVKRDSKTEVIALFNLDLGKIHEGFRPSFHFFID